jgi:hypothetical protein
MGIRMLRALALFCATTMAAVTTAHTATSSARAEIPVDLELLLAVDVSSSVDADEYELQMRGLANAFLHPDVHAAIQAAGDHGVAIALMLWSDYAWQILSVPWTLVRGSDDAARLAARIGATGRLISGGGTAISSAISVGMEELNRNAFDGTRRVIDVSGDGPSTFTAATEAARDAAIAHGIVINGLPILTDDPELEGYYRDKVIGGTGAFVLAAADYNAFATAIVAKLVREIARAPLSGVPHTPQHLAENGMRFKER